MTLSIRKERKKYVEGVILSPVVKGLFRSIPPKLSLAIVKSEKEEKTYRKHLMEEHGVTELEAAFIDAEEMRGVK